MVVVLLISPYRPKEGPPPFWGSSQTRGSPKWLSKKRGPYAAKPSECVFFKGAPKRVEIRLVSLSTHPKRVPLENDRPIYIRPVWVWVKTVCTQNETLVNRNQDEHDQNLRCPGGLYPLRQTHKTFWWLIFDPFRKTHQTLQRSVEPPYMCIYIYNDILTYEKHYMHHAHILRQTPHKPLQLSVFRCLGEVRVGGHFGLLGAHAHVRLIDLWRRRHGRPGETRGNTGETDPNTHETGGKPEGNQRDTIEPRRGIPPLKNPNT